MMIVTGIQSGLRLGQASRVKIVTKNETSAQIDGEPWLQQPGVLFLERKNQVRVCYNSLGKRGTKRRVNFVKEIMPDPCQGGTGSMPSFCSFPFNKI